jgi:hypothetical protein
VGHSCEQHGSFFPCTAPVPAELESACLCVYHFTIEVEQSCVEMHRQIALGVATAERQAQVATYIGERSLLLAFITSNLCLSDDLKRRVLSTFLSLMNLRENLDRASGHCVPALRATRSATSPTPAV